MMKILPRKAFVASVFSLVTLGSTISPAVAADPPHPLNNDPDSTSGTARDCPPTYVGELNSIRDDYFAFLNQVISKAYDSADLSYIRNHEPSDTDNKLGYLKRIVLGLKVSRA
jgi:hypothetical protein